MSNSNPLLFRDDYGRAISERGASGSKRLRCVVSNARVRWVELKNVDTTAFGTPWLANSNGLVTPLTLLATGSGPTDRVGRSVRWCEAQMRLKLVAGGGQGGPISARVALVWDRQPSGALPAALDIFDDVGSSTLQGWSTPRMDKMDRFVIVWERIYPLQEATDQAIHVENIRLELESCVSVYSGSTAAITDVSSGALYAVVFSDFITTGSGDDPYVQGSVRMLYADC